MCPLSAARDSALEGVLDMVRWGILLSTGFLI